MADPLLKKGRNCWRIEPCRRAAFLVDGEAYFTAFAAAVEQARRQVLILGWDIDSRLRLFRDGGEHKLPGEMGRFLRGALSRRKRLQIHILDWDFSMLYALEREMLPALKFGGKGHRRLHFELDGRHPVGASHHQKIVVVDDKVAFVGGMDLSSGRWDTPGHDPADPRRRDNGKTYPPQHDVQMMVDGPAAAALGELARQRWERGTGKSLKAPRSGTADPWPPRVAPDMEGVSVGISRTEPAHNGRSGVCEIKNFHLDAIAAARSIIYIENQYLTSAAAGEALAARLGEEDGPEVIAIAPLECSGWLEAGAMGINRSRLLRRLRAADRYGRLRVCHPVFRGTDIYVHAKVMIVDDLLLRIGSSNLNNRSMGLDSECDLVIEAANPRHRQGIARLRNRLLGEHLGLSPEQAEEMIAEKGSLRGAIDARHGSERHLKPLLVEEEDLLEELVPGPAFLDPERPVTLEKLARRMVSEEAMNGKEPESNGKVRKPGIYLLPGAIVLALALAAAWRLTPLVEWLNFQTLAEWGRTIGDSPLAPLLVVAAFAVGGLIMFPVTVLILVTALTFGPVSAFFYSLLGSLCSGALTFGLGRLMGRETVRKLSRGRLKRLSKLLSRRGTLAVAAVRILPIAPFTVVNLVAGATHIRFVDFLLGTLVGMAPGVLAITVFERGLESAIREPQAKNFIILLFILLSIWVVAWLLRRWISARREG